MKNPINRLTNSINEQFEEANIGDLDNFWLLIFVGDCLALVALTLEIFLK